MNPETVTSSQLHKVFSTLDVLLSAQMSGLRKKALNIMVSLLVHNAKNIEDYKEIYKILPFSRLVGDVD